MEVLGSRTPLIPLSLPVICFINIVFQDQLPAVRGNKFEYAQKTKRIEWQGSKQPAKGLYVCLNHAKTQAGMQSASLSPCFCWVTGRINIWPLMHFFEVIKKVKRSIIYSSSAGNSVRQTSSVRAAVSHFVERRSESRGLAAAERRVGNETELRVSNPRGEFCIGVTRLVRVFASNNWLNNIQQSDMQVWS